jgi:Zinc carboxypeptidase/Immune inhibitor A peptidase M6
VRRLGILATGALTASLAGLAGVVPSAALPSATAASAKPAADAPTVFVGDLSVAQFGLLAAGGVDRTEITTRPGTAKDRVGVEVVLTPRQAAKLVGQGVTLSEKKVAGRTVSRRLRSEAAEKPSVFRSYSEPGGIKDELIATAAAHPGLAKKVVIGRTVQGQDIVAVKVTRGAGQERDGSRPVVLYSAAQHAREWITPEMDRRLMHHYIDAYATDPKIRRIVDTTELWFVPVANPDGYDYTFTEGNRLWRKNLRDNDGDGAITGADGVDPNRNYPAKWGYDNEGSSPSPSSETYRGTAPASEPETRALDGLMKKLRPTYLVNYHSAAQLLLYGVGWQVATPSPDDQISMALAGDDAKPAVPGYDPDISAELYTTNGETDDQAGSAYGTLAFTPEMSTCQTASGVDPDDAFDPADCDSVFNFPDSEALIEQEYEKNLPFALSVAVSAQDPDDPVSSLGLKAPDFDVDSFSVSYGDPQTVAVVARRALKGLRLDYSINGGHVRHTGVREWKGGERYGDTGRTYYGEFRGEVRGAKVGDKVEVWFDGRRSPDGSGPRTERTSRHFTYRVAQKPADVVVIADEDYNGVNPTYPASVTAPKYARDYVDALRAKGISAVVWDVSKQGVPHHLGVLGHFKAAVWYLGDNRLTQDPEDELTSFLGGDERDLSVAEREQYLTMSVRDYLNEGGKLVHTGETAAYYGQLGSALGGIYYGLDGYPDQDCVVTEDPFSDCLLLADDFAQYYLGAYSRGAVSSPTGVVGTGAPLTGAKAAFGGPAATANPLDEPGSFTVTADVLPPAQFPLFRSRASAAYQGSAGGAFDPVEGSWYVGTVHTDDTWTRLARTVDLGAVPAGAAPALSFAVSYDTEPGYDNVVVEAHTAGSDDWTTLPEAGGLSDNAVPDECEGGFLLREHPFLEHYLTLGADGCTATGSTGSWNRLTGNSNGWKQVSYDLSAYAGKKVEVAVSYVTDPSSGGAGVFVDDTRVVVGGATTAAEGFETGLGAWSIPGPPAGSPDGATGFARSQSLFSAAVTTADTVLLGFGVEQLATPAQRADVLGRAVKSLIG